MSKNKYEYVRLRKNKEVKERKRKMKTEICKYVAKALEEVSKREMFHIETNTTVKNSEQSQKKTEAYFLELIPQLMEVPPEEKMGDLALPCYQLAGILHKNPKVIAEELKAALLDYRDELGIEKIETVNGYCNFFLDRKRYVASCINQLMEENFGIEKSGSGKTVCMDYSSPNIAKNFHVGHLRTTLIGNSLYKIYDKLGYHVVRINYLGDWGTQFGKLIVAYEMWSSKKALEEKGIEELLRIYVKFHQEAKTDPSLIQRAREWLVRMEQKDDTAISYWQWFKEISLVEFKRVYNLLGVDFDVWSGESVYWDKVPALAKVLEDKGLLTESQGAQVIDLSQYDMPPCLIKKSDGGSIYHSKDMAAAIDRKQTYDFDRCLYITGMEQTLHFKQVFKALELMGYEWAEDLIHVPYGLVSLDGEKLSTRNGNFIYAEDILKEAIGRALGAIQEKNPNLADKEAVSVKVGVGAVIFHDLFHQRIKNVNFSWDDVLSFEGSTGPYVQYTYARAKSILRKSDIKGMSADGAEESNKCRQEGICISERDYSLLTKGADYSLVKALSGYGEAVKKAAERYEPSIVARYVLSLAAAFNRFYHECPILQAEKEERDSRLLLTELTAKVLLDGCSLLGMECPEEM